jgi:hypothetical protein
MKKSLTLLLVFLVGIVVGFPIGARIGGGWEFALAQGQYKASILSMQIAAIKAGKRDPVALMESSLNDELVKHGQYMESYLSWLWPAEDDHAIRRAVAYRLANPYPYRQGSDYIKPGIDMQSAFVQREIEGQRIAENYLRKVLEHYGDMTPNRSLQTTPKAGG